MRKQATVLGLAAVIAGATFLAPGTALASNQNCKDHGNGRVCAHKSSRGIEVTYTRTKDNNTEVWIKLGYRQGTSYRWDNTNRPIRKKGDTHTVTLPVSAVRNTCVQGAVLPEGTPVADALKSGSFFCN